MLANIMDRAREVPPGRGDHTFGVWRPGAAFPRTSKLAQRSRVAELFAAKAEISDQSVRVSRNSTLRLYESSLNLDNSRYPADKGKAESGGVN
jgi:hypothetical protein